MSDHQPEIETVGGFVDRVSQIREAWGIEKHKELWFRGEGEEHKESILSPALYRPPRGNTVDMKAIGELLEIESELYEEFQRCGAQLLSEKIEEEYQEWDWYFLMRHHDAPTRLLDWSDGALIALHFALSSKTKDALRDLKTKEHCKPRVYVLGDRSRPRKHFEDANRTSRMRCDRIHNFSRP
jgi:FRG domain